MRRESDCCPEDARAFARWDRLGQTCGHDLTDEDAVSPDGECIECIKLADEDAADRHRDAMVDRYRDEGW